MSGIIDQHCSCFHAGAGRGSGIVDQQCSCFHAGAAVGLVLLTSTVRLVMAHVALLRMGLGIKEKMYMSLAFLPAASIQVT